MVEEQNLTKAERKALKRQQKIEREATDEKNVLINRLIKYGLVLVGLVFVGWLVYANWVPIPENEKGKPVDRILADDWLRGNPEAPIVMVEYSDFQCPACKVYKPEVERLLAEYTDSIAVVYRHFPLKQIHLQSDAAAQAAEAAGIQGAFWEMHDKLFEHQEEWAENRSASSMFVGYAEELGLDVNQFKKEVGSKEVKARVKADYMSALENTLSSTPSFFINGELIRNPNGFEGFASVVDELLLAATASADTAVE
jgi:predicted DsbA family dithiol-disulfide isomerase